MINRFDMRSPLDEPTCCAQWVAVQVLRRQFALAHKFEYSGTRNHGIAREFRSLYIEEHLRNLTKI
ncbi:hypothetical protein BSU04_32010 [Caballeronia sordidicola]|uniref:Uncharacterized protein n=1 Tax=Caballeronia sordidicola TaxID=196367 RepID=A0A226WTC7_CABSO|nr:hypothetical protein BSU04_32010 [Caballeronia sordidicola]